MKVYVVGNSTNYANWIATRLVKDMSEADIVLFTGGEDVDPRVYNEPEGKYTYPDYSRDLYEIEEWDKAQKLQKPILGICRGAQLGCALSGGRLIQHMDGSGFIHLMKTENGLSIPISSLHHQAQFPYEMPKDSYKVLAWTTKESKIHWDGDNKEISNKPFKEVEAAYYPLTRCLGIQGHPEMMYGSTRFESGYDLTFEQLYSWVNKMLDNSL